MSTKIRIEPYLSSPIFALVAGLSIGGFGILAMHEIADSVLFRILAAVLTFCGFSAAIYGFMGMLEGKQVRKLTKSELREVRTLTQSLKVRYPTYIFEGSQIKRET